MIWFRKKASGLVSSHPSVREMLLCDLTLAQLADRSDDDPDTPLARFAAARASVQVGDRATARRHLHELLELPIVDTRTRLLAWNCLRELDELPSPAAAAAVRGVVVERGETAGLTTIAAFEDLSAQVIRPHGDVLGTTAPLGAYADAIARMLTTARGVVEHTDPHRGAPENAPEVGHACIRVLTFAGTHVGLGPTATLERDAVGGPVLTAATALARALQPDHEHAG